jgi:hypothetical protein
MAGGSPAATAELCVAGSPDGSPGRKSPSPPPFPADADDVEDDRFARPCDFAIRLVKLHNVPLTPGEQVEVAWEGFHQSGVTSAIVHADGTAPLRHRFHIHHRPHAEGPTAGRPSVHELHFCVRHVRPNYGSAVILVPRPPKLQHRGQSGQAHSHPLDLRPPLRADGDRLLEEHRSDPAPGGHVPRSGPPLPRRPYPSPTPLRGPEALCKRGCGGGKTRGLPGPLPPGRRDPLRDS